MLNVSVLIISFFTPPQTCFPSGFETQASNSEHEILLVFYIGSWKTIFTSTYRRTYSQSSFFSSSLFCFWCHLLQKCNREFLLYIFLFLTESKPVHIEVKEQNEVDEEEEEEDEEEEEEEESEESEDSEGSEDEDEKTSDEREADSQAIGKQSMEKKPSKEISSDSEYDSDDDRTKEERAYDKAKRRIEVLRYTWILVLYNKQINFQLILSHLSKW